jgi:topoisomerase-4 subunit B
MAKVKDTQELRKELQNVKKLARERAKAITLRIPQLKDCKNHSDKKKEKGKGTMVFICEGQSAAGSITNCSDVNNQAVFVLKGKPLNVWDLKRDVMYKNDEMYNLMQSLNVEDNTEGLRYDKVILATDADVDGMHIRNLMITYFFRFFEQLVHERGARAVGQLRVVIHAEEACGIIAGTLINPVEWHHGGIGRVERFPVSEVG